MRIPGRLAGLLVLATVAGCDSPGGSGSGAPPTDPEPGTEARSAPGGAYERAVVFVAPREDSLLLIPWILEATSRPGGVDRLHRGWLLSNDEWDPFFRSEWESPPNREPWRILPRGPFRILVGEEDRLDRILFDGGARRLELTLGEPRAEWTGNEGSSFALLEGQLTLADRRIDGVVLDVSQGFRLADTTLGDWVFLISGDSLAVVVQSPESVGDGARAQGWAALDGQEIQWPEAEMRWVETRAFEPARRDIPSVLSVVSPDSTLVARLQVRSIQLETRPGEGPVLPVDGLMRVAGTVELGDGTTWPVDGLLRHRQPGGTGVE